MTSGLRVVAFHATEHRQNLSGVGAHGRWHAGGHEADHGQRQQQQKQKLDQVEAGANEKSDPRKLFRKCGAASRTGQQSMASRLTSVAIGGGGRVRGSGNTGGPIGREMLLVRMADNRSRACWGR
jgi:hypothetical protein